MGHLSLAHFGAVILLLYAHPHPRRSVANRVLLDGVRDLDGVAVHALYAVSYTHLTLPTKA